MGLVTLWLGSHTSNTELAELLYINIEACYDLKSLGSDDRTTLVLSNTRELDRVPSIK